MALSSRSTKAEILAAYQALEARQTSWHDVWRLTTETAATVATEAAALVKDCYQLGRTARRWYDSVVATLSRPIIKS